MNDSFLQNQAAFFEEDNTVFNPEEQIARGKVEHSFGKRKEQLRKAKKVLREKMLGRIDALKAKALDAFDGERLIECGELKSSRRSRRSCAK